MHWYGRWRLLFRIGLDAWMMIGPEGEKDALNGAWTTFRFGLSLQASDLCVYLGGYILGLKRQNQLHRGVLWSNVRALMHWIVYSRGSMNTSSDLHKNLRRFMQVAVIRASPAAKNLDCVWLTETNAPRVHWSLTYKFIRCCLLLTFSNLSEQSDIMTVNGKPTTGSCLCGAIKYSFTGAPVNRVCPFFLHLFLPILP